MDRNFLTSSLFLHTLWSRFREDMLKPRPFSTYFIKKENWKKLNVRQLLNVATGLSFSRVFLMKTVVSMMGTAPKKERASSWETQANIYIYIYKYIYISIHTASRT